MTTSLTLEIPRAWLLNANQRLNHWERARRTSDLRRYGFAVARHASARRSEPYQRQVRLIAWVSWPDRRRHDGHNVTPTLKPAIDGLVDAGMFVDDSDAWLIGPDIRPTGDLCDKRFACVIRLDIEEMT